MISQASRSRIGVDVGGTKTRYGIVGPDGTILAEHAVPTDSSISCRTFMRQILAGVDELAGAHAITLRSVAGIGIGIPGTTDIERGYVLYCPNLPWEGEPLADIVEDITQVRPRVMQDSRCAAWAEHRLTTAPGGPTSLLAVTVGTGIGSGLVIDDQLFHGPLGTAGEIGHSTLRYGGLDCSCGRRGCLEQYASGTAIARKAQQVLGSEIDGVEVTTPMVFQLAAAGDGEAWAIIDEATTSLAVGITNAINLLGIDRVVISGGLSRQRHLFITPLRQKISEMAYEPWKRTAQVTVEASDLGAAAPMIGAAFLDTLPTPARDQIPLTTPIPDIGGNHATHR